MEKRPEDDEKVSLLNDEPKGATPLSPDDLAGLKPPHIQTREQLNDVEAANILQGQIWAGGLTSPAMDDIFSRDFVTELHERLFGDVWEWAGKLRLRELNIGTDPARISVYDHGKDRLHLRTAGSRQGRFWPDSAVSSEVRE